MTVSAPFLLTGLMAGYAVAVPIGPMGLLCIQRTLACGMPVGVCTGLGAATVNVLYAGAILLGSRGAAPALASGSRVLSFAGGLFLLWSAARTLARARAGLPQAGAAPLSPAAAYGTAVAFNATNPMAPVLILALLAPVVAAGAPGWGEAASLLAGMFAAAASWWVCLSGAVAHLRTRVRPGMLVALNHGAGVLLTLYGALALARSFG